MNRVAENQMLHRIERFFPKSIRLPIILVFVFNLVAYFGAKLFIGDANYIDLALPIDESLPFVSPFIVVYILAYLQWGIGYLLVGYDNRRRCLNLCAGALCAKLICLICFILIPTTIERPSIEGSGLFSQLTRIIYRLDTPLCLFPSIHCLESWIVFRAAMGVKKAPRWYAPLMGVFTLLVMLSTLLVKQHLVVDVPAGILVAEVGLFISRRFNPSRVFERKGVRE